MATNTISGRGLDRPGRLALERIRERRRQLRDGNLVPRLNPQFPYRAESFRPGVFGATPSALRELTSEE